MTSPSSPQVTSPARQIREIGVDGEGGTIDLDLIQKYVNKFAGDLTNRAFIGALIDPPPGLNPNSATAVGFREASKNLSATRLTWLKRANNAAFLKVYTETLLSVVALKLLKNHLLARDSRPRSSWARRDSPEAIETFIAQLNDW